MSDTKAKINTARAMPALRHDRWVNTRNRFGGSGDPITNTTYFRDFSVTRELLTAMFRYDWVSRRAVSIVAEDATREWITLQHDDPKRVQEAEDELERIDARGKFEEAILLGRLYGGAVMILGVFDGRDVTEPLGTPRQTHFLANVDRWLAYPQSFYQDPMDPRFGEPEHYLVNRLGMPGSHIAYVHESRVIRFDGAYLPQVERLRNFTFGASVIENFYESLRQFGVATQSGASVLEDFITKKLKINNLAELLTTTEGQQLLTNRLAIMAAEMSINNLAVYGEDEDFDKMGTPISGLPDLLDRFIDIMAAATGVPKSRFFSTTSGALGGDAGQNDLRSHYDNIASYQRNRLRAKVQRFLDVILGPLGFAPGEMGFEFDPLWQLTEQEMADVRLKVAQSDEIYVRMGIVTPEEVAMSRFSGDGIKLDDMQIEVEPRQKFLDDFRTGRIPTDEVSGEKGAGEVNEPAEDENGGD